MEIERDIEQKPQNKNDLNWMCVYAYYACKLSWIMYCHEIDRNIILLLYILNTPNDNSIIPSKYCYYIFG